MNLYLLYLYLFMRIYIIYQYIIYQFYVSCPYYIPLVIIRFVNANNAPVVYIAITAIIVIDMCSEFDVIRWQRTIYFILD